MKSALFALSAVLFASSAMAADKPCIFGEELLELEANKRFEQKEIGKTFKLSREFTPVNSLLWVTVTELKDTKTKRVYHLNTTSDDAYDGGNTVGWIEDVTRADDGIADGSPRNLKGTGAAVATIGDSFISCK
jgi:hypothetical protein